MTHKIRQAHNTMEDVRRTALDSERFSTVFYGGWYVVDNVTGDATYVNGRERCIRLAELKNEEVRS